MSTLMYRLPCGCTVTYCDQAVANKTFCEKETDGTETTAPCGCSYSMCDAARSIYPPTIHKHTDDYESRIQAAEAWQAHGLGDALDAAFERLTAAL